MIILLFVVMVLLFIFSIIKSVDSYSETWDNISSLLFFVVLGVGVIMVCLIFIVSKGSTIDQRIALYEEKNAEIESNISELVQNYMEYEQNTFESVSNKDSAIVLVSLYPELKSDTLVEGQCNLYIENNKKITQLKEDKINLSVKRWWLYFGH